MKIRRIYFKGDEARKFKSYTGAIADESNWEFLTLIQKTMVGDEQRIYISVATLKEIIANAEAHKEV